MAQNGVWIRFPPANGLVASAVWQLAQSPASVSALPLAIVSGDGSAGSSARACSRLNAVHKARPMRIVRALRCHGCVDGYPMGPSIAEIVDARASRRCVMAFLRDIRRKANRPTRYEIAF